jgi:hypothetical protein
MYVRSDLIPEGLGTAVQVTCTVTVAVAGTVTGLGLPSVPTAELPEPVPIEVK